MVHAFISCRLHYCNSLLTEISDGLLGRLQSAQNAAARLFTHGDVNTLRWYWGNCTGCLSGNASATSWRLWCTGHYQGKHLITSLTTASCGRLWARDTTIIRIRTLSLYCATLQHHVWRTIIRYGWPTYVERVAQRSPQHWTWQSAHRG